VSKASTGGTQKVAKEQVTVRVCRASHWEREVSIIGLKAVGVALLTRKKQRRGKGTGEQIMPKREIGKENFHHEGKKVITGAPPECCGTENEKDQSIRLTERKVG